MLETPAQSVTTLPEQVAALPDETRTLVKDLFSVVRSQGHLIPPPEMWPWLEKAFGSVRAVEAQTVLKVTNRWTLEGSLFNDLRARRPIQSLGGPAPSLDGDGQDSFCTPLTGTPSDTFGRIKGRHVITASNVAKYDGLHAVIILPEHDPLAWTADHVADAFETAGRWFTAAAKADPAAIYPFMIWNCLPRSGASILHGHMQAALSEGEPYARVELWRRANVLYRERHGRDYFADFYAAHDALGLAGTDGPVRWLAHLTPIKEKELILIAPAAQGPQAALSPDLAHALYRALRRWIDGLGVRAFNVAVYLPPLAPDAADWAGFPVVVRMVDRGNPEATTSDIGAMELFAQPVVAFDPWKLAALMR
jgi:hypothetical protein